MGIHMAVTRRKRGKEYKKSPVKRESVHQAQNGWEDRLEFV